MIAPSLQRIEDKQDRLKGSLDTLRYVEVKEFASYQSGSGAGAGGGAPNPLPIDSRPTPSSTVKQFDDCNAAAAWLNTGEFAADAQVVYSTSAGEITVTKKGKSFKASVKITWSLDPSSSIELIEPTWPNMTKADKTAVAKFKAALKAHENGHFAKTDAVIARRPTTITATGPTAANAVAKLKTKAETEQTNTYAAYIKASEDYDTKTQHGRNQAAVRGRNVHLACPRPPAPKKP